MGLLGTPDDVFDAARHCGVTMEQLQELLHDRLYDLDEENAEQIGRLGQREQIEHLARVGLSLVRLTADVEDMLVP